MIRTKTKIVIPQVVIYDITYQTGFAVAYDECECAVQELLDEIEYLDY